MDPLEKQLDLSTDPLEKQLGSNCFSRVSVPVYQREPIATCDFPGWGLDPLPLSSEYAHDVDV